ncbi:Progestin and adipoQ receptor member 3, partial [Coelomomyces lativittatus]
MSPSLRPMSKRTLSPSPSRHLSYSGTSDPGTSGSDADPLLMLDEDKENNQRLHVHVLQRSHPSLPSLSTITSPSTSSCHSEHEGVDLEKIKPNRFATAFWTQRKLPLYTFDQIPLFLQDNEYIRTGYRMHYTYKESWASMFFLHNEFGNIWTHVLALLVFALCAWYLPNFFPKEDPQGPRPLLSPSPHFNPSSSWSSIPLLGWLFDPVSSFFSDPPSTPTSGSGSGSWSWTWTWTGSWWTSPMTSHHWVFLFFLLSACHCFTCSVLFHTHYSNNVQAFRTFGCLDYAGISVLICGSAVLVAYYLHYCSPTLQWVYGISLILMNSVGIIGPVFQTWASPQFRVGRTLIYLGSGLGSGLPLLHFLWLHGGIPENLPFWGLYGFGIMGLTYLLGAT